MNISIAGSICSVIGAIIAIWQASRAKNFRDEICRDRKKMILIDCRGDIRMARKECRKIITPVNKKPRGINNQKVINAVREHFDRIKDNIGKFDSRDLKLSITDLNDQINKYILENDESKRYKIADKMNDTIDDISKIITEEIDGGI